MREHIFGTLTLIFSVSMVVIGLPSQIYKNYSEQRCGLALSIIIIMLGIGASRVPYCYFKKAYYTIPSDAIGFILFLVLLYQYIIYY